MTRWRDKHEPPREAHWGAWLFHRHSHPPAEGKFHNYLPLNGAFVMKGAAFLGNVSPSLQERRICNSEVMSEWITLLDLKKNFRLAIFVTVPFGERLICTKETSRKNSRETYSPEVISHYKFETVLYISSHLKVIWTFFQYRQSSDRHLEQKFLKCSLFTDNKWVEQWQNSLLQRNRVYGVRTIKTQASDKCICLYICAPQKGTGEGTTRSSGWFGSVILFRLCYLCREVIYA